MLQHRFAKEMDHSKANHMNSHLLEALGVHSGAATKLSGALSKCKESKDDDSNRLLISEYLAKDSSVSSPAVVDFTRLTEKVRIANEQRQRNPPVEDHEEHSKTGPSEKRPATESLLQPVEKRANYGAGTVSVHRSPNYLPKLSNPTLDSRDDSSQRTSATSRTLGGQTLESANPGVQHVISSSQTLGLESIPSQQLVESRQSLRGGILTNQEHGRNSQPPNSPLSLSRNSARGAREFTGLQRPIHSHWNNTNTYHPADFQRGETPRPNANKPAQPMGRIEQTSCLPEMAVEQMRTFSRPNNGAVPRHPSYQQNHMVQTHNHRFGKRDHGLPYMAVEQHQPEVVVGESYRHPRESRAFYPRDTRREETNNGLPYMAEEQYSRFPVAIPKVDSDGTFSWKTDISAQLGTELETAFHAHFMGDRKKEKRWASYEPGNTDCVLTHVIGRGGNHSSFSQPFTACDKCSRAERPCVFLVNQGERTVLGFYRADPSSRGGSADDAGFYVPVKAAAQRRNGL
ncbi:uncharacterized protein N0V89_012295 [Didymosphaeria variabile]|uniref:Uncharacterized protein n=1 Tax=Didymosphaeria variabile TaxID=1932322 RepID=A0A9W9C596_9PLEO|nr:uncharacterized protein N0V89_012295 [Didymosphaeria variabile]KAJ4344551.1 hypothetical protein N0V89_012295 [Didymosphaeria variabile]